MPVNVPDVHFVHNGASLDLAREQVRGGQVRVKLGRINLPSVVFQIVAPHGGKAGGFQINRALAPSSHHVYQVEDQSQ